MDSQLQQSNSNCSFDISKGQINRITPNPYKQQNKLNKNQVSYSISSNMNSSMNGSKIPNLFTNSPLQTNQQTNSTTQMSNQINRLQNSMGQKRLAHNSSQDYSAKKQDVRTNSQHSQTFTQQQQQLQNGPLISNILQNIDNSKSTDNSPQLRGYNSNININQNQYITTSLQLSKAFNQQICSNSSSSKSLLRSSTNSLQFPSGNVTNTASKQSVKHKQNLSQSNQSHTYSQQQQQQQSTFQSLNQFSLSHKDGYLQQNAQATMCIQSPHKPMSATLPAKQPLTYLSAQQYIQKCESNCGSAYTSNYINSTSKQQLFSTQIMQSQYLQQYQQLQKQQQKQQQNEVNKNSSNSKQLEDKQWNKVGQNEVQQESQQNDIYQYQEDHPIINNDQEEKDNQFTSSNVTEEEGAKLYTLESSSLRSQQQQISPQPMSYNQPDINYEKDQKIFQLQKEKLDLIEKVKNLEQQLDKGKELLQTQLELERYKIRESYENEQKQRILQIKQEFEEKEQSLKQEIQFQSQKERTSKQDSILESLQSMVAQNLVLQKQYQWIQEKLCSVDQEKEDRQPSSETSKQDQCQISLENIVSLCNHNQNQILGQIANNGNTKSSKREELPKKILQADIIQEENDSCSTLNYQEKGKSPKERKHLYQASLSSENERGTSEQDNSMVNSNKSQEKNDDKHWNEEISASPFAKKRLNRNGSILFTTEGRIEELERIIGAKNHEIHDLKEKLYEAKDQMMQHIPNSQRMSIPLLTSQDYFPQKRRKSFSSSSDLHSLNTLQNIRKPIQNSIMEWSYSFDCQGSVEKLLEDGWKIQEHHCKVNLTELNQVIGVVGMPKTGKTTIINGLMKGNLQTVEELKKSTFFEPKLNIVLDENIAIFEYSYMQPIQIENTMNLSVSSIADLSQQKQYSTIMEEQILKTNKRDFFWIDFFIKNTQTLIVVFDKFTQEEQKMLSEILNRIENEENLYTKELILIHNYYSKGLKSAQELQSYFGESLQHIDTNFKQKSMVELKMYRTVLVQKSTKSKKCISISHILNGNLFEPFADKYQHNMLQYCMDKLSQINQSSKKFMPQFQSFLQTNINQYLCQNNISSFQQFDNQKQFKDYLLNFDQENQQLTFKSKEIL